MRNSKSVRKQVLAQFTNTNGYISIADIINVKDDRTFTEQVRDFVSDDCTANNDSGITSFGSELLFDAEMADNMLLKGGR